MAAIAGNLLKWDLFLFDCVITRPRRLSLDGFLCTISRSADGEAFPALMLLIILLRLQDWRVVVIVFVASFALELSVFKALKQVVRRPRPSQALAGVVQLVVPPDLFSFPSGHTAAAFVAAVLVGHWFGFMITPLWIWASLVGFSRIYLGVHYPADVLAGANNYSLRFSEESSLRRRLRSPPARASGSRSRDPAPEETYKCRIHSPTLHPHQRSR